MHSKHQNNKKPFYTTLYVYVNSAWQNSEKQSRSRNKSYTPKNKLKKVRGGATMTLF